MGPYKCPDCGVWWAGLEHRCQPTPPPTTDASDTFRGDGWVVRLYDGAVSSGSSTSAPWCPFCAGWHIPGAGPCTANYCAATA